MSAGPKYLWDNWEWVYVSFHSGKRVSATHEAQFYNDQSLNRFHIGEEGVHLSTFMPRRFYPKLNDLPTHRREIDLYPELTSRSNLQR